MIVSLKKKPLHLQTKHKKKKNWDTKIISLALLYFKPTIFSSRGSIKYINDEILHWCLPGQPTYNMGH